MRLLERESELDRLRDALDDAGAGRGHLVVVEGPAGIGKTELLKAARGLAEEARFRVLAATGGELERDFPHGVVRQLFEGDLAARPPVERADLLSGAAELAAPVVATKPGPRIGVPHSDAPFGVTHGLYWLTANIAEKHPLLLVVDDAQWADVASLRFLLYLARRLEGLSLILLVGVRTGDPAVAAPFLSGLVEQAGADVIRPASLSVEGVARLLELGLGEQPQEGFARACHAATGGTPFLVRALVVTLAERGTPPTEESAPEVVELGPKAVARSTLRRLAALPAPATALAHAVAVLGADGGLHRAARLARVDLDEAVTAAGALAEMDILGRETPLAFVHPIVRSAIYDDIPTVTRQAAHARAAELLADENADLDAIAAHLLLTEPAASDETVGLLREAASHALARGAAESADKYLRRALEEAGPTAPHRVELLCERARAAKLLGYTHAIEPLEEAYDLASDPIARARIAHDLAESLFFVGHYDRASLLVAAAIEEVQHVDPELSMRLETVRAGQAFQDARNLPEFLTRLPELATMALEGGKAARGMALLVAGVSAWVGRPVAEIHALIEKGLDGGRFLAEEGAESWQLPYAHQALVLTEDLPRAARLVEDSLAEARRRGSWSGDVFSRSFRAWINARLGALAQVEADLRAVGDHVREHHLNFEIVLLFFCTDALLERPALDDLAQRVQEFHPDPTLVRAEHTIMPYEMRGRLRLAKGDLAGAIDDLGRCEATLHAHGNPNGWHWRPALALALAQTDRERALGLADTHLRYTRHIGTPRGIGIALRTLGQVMGGEEGIAHLEQAVSVLEPSPARLEHARALVALGETLRRANARASAREPLRAGLDLAHRCGAIRLEERARAELIATGARPRRAMITGRDALTATEQRIAAMAADGLSNPEIAQSLLVTRKTIESHLSKAYGKLGIHSRSELPDALGRDADGAASLAF